MDFIAEYVLASLGRWYKCLFRLCAALKTAFYRATMTALGYDPDKAYKKIKPPVRMTYPPLGNPDWTMKRMLSLLPSWTRTVTMCRSQYMNFGKMTEKTWLRSIMRPVLQVIFTAYGPNGYDRLVHLRHTFLDGSSVLRSADIFIIPSSDTPQYVPELFHNRWFERTDLDTPVQ
ncbi:MAG: hypothetical protein ACLU45_01825 [Dialister invisus]|uniref:hypothetical protein n=1 Tax=Dialister invisus TaxID=218538 RepID=UPI00399BECC9